MFQRMDLIILGYNVLIFHIYLIKIKHYYNFLIIFRKRFSYETIYMEYKLKQNEQVKIFQKCITFF